MVQASAALTAAIAAGKPQRVLLEFMDSSGNVTRTFSNEDVAVDRGVTLRETFNGDTDLSVGQCPSATLRFTLLNDANQITSFEFGKFKAWLGARIDTGTPTGKTATFLEGGVSRTYEFAPLGVFIAERPNVVRKQMIDIESYDQMGLFDVGWPSDDCGITFGNNATMAVILQAMCNKVGVTLHSTSFLNATDLRLTSKPKGLADSTMKEVLGWIAEAAGSVARFNRDGELEIVWFGQTGLTYSEGDYAEFEPSWYAVDPVTKLSIRNADATRESVVGTGTNGYIIQNNPFLRGGT